MPPFAFGEKTAVFRQLPEPPKSIAYWGRNYARLAHEIALRTFDGLKEQILKERISCDTALCFFGNMNCFTLHEQVDQQAADVVYHLQYAQVVLLF
jgi:hypothetical protein